MTAIVSGVVTRVAAAVTGCLRLFAAFSRMDNAFAFFTLRFVIPSQRVGTGYVPLQRRRVSLAAKVPWRWR